MTEWLYEAGIGEARAALVADGGIVEARIELEGQGPRVGAVVAARLGERLPGGSVRALLDGGDAVLGRVPQGLTQGARLNVEIVREALPERGRPKPARARPTDAEPEAGSDLLARIRATGVPVRTVRPHEADHLEAAGWTEVLESAVTGELPFAGGALRMSVTPAMTLFDVDGAPPLEPLAVAAARAVGAAIRRFDIQGSIGIDFPTLEGKAARQAVADAIDAALPQPFERTAMNGFGFLQIVRRRVRPSLPELLLADPVGAQARAFLRQLERLPPPVPATHMVGEAVARRLAERPDWTDMLAARMGGHVRFVTRTSGGQDAA